MTIQLPSENSGRGAPTSAAEQAYVSLLRSADRLPGEFADWR
jgi:hypothetical protein